jgi:hypothetical protein
VAGSKPKRISIASVSAAGERLTVAVSTADARWLLASLRQAIDEAEADKGPCRRGSRKTPAGKKPKRSPKPSRARRIENAALHTIAKVEAISQSAAVIVALEELRAALGVARQRTEIKGNVL